MVSEEKIEVSVVIPFFNAIKTLERAVESVLAQKGVVLEIILVDNNSVDGSKGVAEKIKQKHEEVRMLHEPNQGVAFARNLGLQNASGQFIQFLDADDILLPGKILRQLRMLKVEIPVASWVMGASIRCHPLYGETIWGVNGDYWKGLVSGGFGHTNGNLYLRDILLMIGGQDVQKKVGEDTDMLFRLLKNKAYCIQDQEPGAYHYDDAEGSLTVKNSGLMAYESLRIGLKVVTYLNKEEAGYFEVNRSFFVSHILALLRDVARYDLETAKKVFFLFEKIFRGTTIRVDVVPKRVTYMYRAIGFSCAESLLRVTFPIRRMVAKMKKKAMNDYKFLLRFYAIPRHVKKIIRSYKGKRFFDPIEVYYEVDQKTVYPINSKSGNSSLKTLLIKRVSSDFDAVFPDIHMVDPADYTSGKVLRLYFYTAEDYVRFCKGKTICLVIRNPVDRFYSCFQDVVTGKNSLYMYPSKLYNIFRFTPSTSWAGFQRKIFLIPDNIADKHFRSQSFYLMPELISEVDAIYVHEMKEFFQKEILLGVNRHSLYLNKGLKTINVSIAASLVENKKFQKRYKNDIILFNELEGKNYLKITTLPRPWSKY